MQIQLERAKNIGRKIGLNDDKGYAVAILLALVIMAALLAGYYVLFRPAPAGYSTIYLLDSQNKAVNYPQLLVAGKNSTFNVPFTVVNNLGSTTQYEVLIKITNNLSTFPVNAQPAATYQVTLNNGQSLEKTATLTENQIGNYSVVFELWSYNSDPNVNAYQFTHDFCVLPIQVVS
ncbi:MAG TPA: DUF1616 domain-containing protein [Candidatus Limnocylindrales bacterium]|nr:DUF1616 domain-containing protein [Candidatus Limnocylindrales bacterium]